MENANITISTAQNILCWTCWIMLTIWHHASTSCAYDNNCIQLVSNTTCTKDWYSSCPPNTFPPPSLLPNIYHMFMSLLNIKVSAASLLHVLVVSFDERASHAFTLLVPKNLNLVSMWGKWICLQVAFPETRGALIMLILHILQIDHCWQTRQILTSTSSTY